MIEQFQKLDDLIVEHTKPPVTAILRNQLALTREQIEAYQAASDKQDETLSTQAQTIDRLMKYYQESESKKAEAKKGAWDELKKQSDSYHAMLRSKQLRYK